MPNPSDIFRLSPARLQSLPPEFVEAVRRVANDPALVDFNAAHARFLRETLLGAAWPEPVLVEERREPELWTPTPPAGATWSQQTGATAFAWARERIEQQAFRQGYLAWRREKGLDPTPEQAKMFLRWQTALCEREDMAGMLLIASREDS